MDEKVTLSNTALPGSPYTSKNGRNIDGSYTKVGQREKFSRQVPRLENRRSRTTLQPSSGASMVGNGSDDEDDIKGESASSSAAEEQLQTESDTDSNFEDFYDEKSSDHGSRLIDYEVKGYRDSLSRNINLSATFVTIEALRRRGIRRIPCVYCSIKYDIDCNIIEALNCYHWACHFCLIERFALALVSSEFKIRCCNMDITLQPFGRILIDPAINHLWATGYFREYDEREEGPEDSFILSLYERGILRDLWVVGELEYLTGLELSVVRAKAEEDTFETRKLDLPIKYMEFIEIGQSKIRVREEEDVVANYKGQAGSLKRHGIPWVEIWRWINDSYDGNDGLIR